MGSEKQVETAQKTSRRQAGRRGGRGRWGVREGDLETAGRGGGVHRTKKGVGSAKYEGRAGGAQYEGGGVECTVRQVSEGGREGRLGNMLGVVLSQAVTRRAGNLESTRESGPAGQWWERTSLLSHPIYAAIGSYRLEAA